MPHNHLLLEPVILCSANTIAFERVRDVDEKRAGAVLLDVRGDFLMIFRLMSAGLRATCRLSRHSGGDDETSLPARSAGLVRRRDAAVVAVTALSWLMSSALPLMSPSAAGCRKQHVSERLLHREQREVAADLPASHETDLVFAHDGFSLHVFDDRLAELAGT